jgi:hypothetical protein
MTERSFVLNKYSTPYLSAGGVGQIPLQPNQYVVGMAFKVPRQEQFALIRNPRVTAKLYNTAGEQISDGAKLMISIRKPNQELPQEIGTYKFYADYAELDLSEQSNTKYEANTRFEMKNEGIFPEDSELLILISSPVAETLDWDNPNTRLSIGRTGQNDLRRLEL